MHFGIEAVENSYVVPELQMSVHQVRSDKAGTPGYEHSHSKASEYSFVRRCMLNYFPDPVNTSAAVFRRIQKSSVGLQRRMYSKSNFTHSSKSLILFLPLTCHKHVIPGFT